MLLFSKKKSPKSKSKKKDKSLLRQIGREIGDGVKSIEETLEEIGSEINREAQVVAKGLKKEIKKKISLFYNISFLILLISSIVLAYFVLLVSTTPKSFPFITNEIRSYLKKNYGDTVALENAYISFTSYGTLKISIKNLKIYRDSSSLGQEKQEFLIPQLESEFSFLNILHSSFIPRKIKIIDPKIIIDDLWNRLQTTSTNNPIEAFISGLSYMKKTKFVTKSLEIENARLILNGGPRGRKEILIKRAQFRAINQDGILYLSSNNQMSFSDARSDVNLNNTCQFGEYDILKCELRLVNFVANSIADLQPELKVLDQIDATLNSTVSFFIDKGKFDNIALKVEARAGSFSFPEFFEQKMFFSDFMVKGEYDETRDTLNFSEIKAELRMHNDADTANPNSLTLKTHLDMSLLMSQFIDLQNNRMDFTIKLQNAPTNELEKLWPVTLQDFGIRQWVITHINNGIIRQASAKFALVEKDDVTTLETMDSELNFTGLDLNYSDDFPTITKVEGKAKFTQKGMNIALTKGDVLGSKIYDSYVVIDDFSAPVTMLKISGKSKGDASDSLKHADASPKFSTHVEKYLNGNSQNSFDIRIPLEEKMELKHAFISIASNITNLSNEYIKGAITATVKKDFGKEDFDTVINFTDAELAIKDLNIVKKTGEAGGLNLVIAFPADKQIDLKNINLWKKETVVLRGKSQIINAKISGNINAATGPFEVTEINIKNENFGRNSYAIFYTTDKKSSTQKLLVRGQVLDLAPILASKFDGFSSDKKTYNNSVIQIALDNLLLANAKAIKNFALGLKCVNQFCYAGAAKGSYNKREESLLVRVNKKPEDNFSTIEAQITDIGYLAEALGISKLISGGNAVVKVQNKIVNKKLVLEGEVTLKDSITIYEKPAVKLLATNDLFSKVRDKIFSNEKTIFDSVKIDFGYSEGVLDIKSLIANNYKIGITAKGKADLKNDAYEIKGMIVPGFIINNLFGIGKIPILGNVISGLLTGGEGGGVFGIKYEYTKKKSDKEATFATYKVSSFVPTTIKNLFDSI